MNAEAVRRTAGEIAARTGRRHRVALVLGSGLSDYAAALPDAVSVPYEELSGFPRAAVEGHAGTLVSARFGSGSALVLAGRVHLYEGLALDEIVFAVRCAVGSGCSTVVLTSAAGGVGQGLGPGDFVLISDHLNLTGRNPLFGDNEDTMGPRFPDMSDVYSPELRAVARQVGDEVGVPLREGIYAWMTGPSYETPAEIEMVARLGGDLVGMSTVPEAIAARHMGADVLGLSLVTNLAAGRSPTPLSHDEVQEATTEARHRFALLLDSLLPRLAAR